jgi:hypothetical protein
MDVVTAKNLARWACRDADNRETLEGWLDESVAAIAAGKGAQVITTAANGVTVSFGSKGMTNAEFFNTLSLALQYIDNPPANKIRGRI